MSCDDVLKKNVRDFVSFPIFLSPFPQTRAPGLNVATAMLPREDGRNRLEAGDERRGAEERERLRRMMACAEEEEDEALNGIALVASVLRGAIILLHDEEEDEARAALMLIMLLLICFVRGRETAKAFPKGLSLYYSCSKEDRK